MRCARIDPEELQSSCQKVIKALKSERSKGYDLQYEDDASCRWLVTNSKVTMAVKTA